MTTTATELMCSPEFWKTRIEQQVEYIARYNARVKSRDDRPDREVVLQSAFFILEQCQEKYLSLVSPTNTNQTERR